MATTKVKQSTRTLGTGEVVDANIATDTISIGKISGSAAASAGTYLKQDGTWAAVASGIAWQAVQTTGFTAVAEKGYPCNTTAGAFTVTLPASASVGDQISIVDYAGTFDTNAVTIDPNGLKLKGATNNLKASTEREGVTLTYVDITQGWAATSGVNTGSPALSPIAYSIDFLVVGGGGGGGKGIGGGGGAGGYRTSTQTVTAGATTITTTVGDGGAGASGGGNGSGSVGVASSISGTGLTTISSAPGGYGGGYNVIGGAGGSGGAGGHVQAGGAGNTPSTSPSQGSSGGGTGGSSASASAGGGGGATSVGATAASNQGGNGGAGTASSITGVSVTYAGGGGGSTHSGGGSGGAGGAGGGGAGGTSIGGVAAGNGTVNTGGGGGGNGYNPPNTNAGGSGGKGVIILSMPDASYTGTTTGSPTVATGVSGKTILTFTGTGSYTA